MDSILAQTWNFIEIILVDDGSTDNSGFICDRMQQKDDRVKSAARNSGIEMASGGFICFVDGDDYVMPDYIEYMMEQIIKNNADITLTTQMFGNFDEKQVKKDEIKTWNGEDAVETILCYQVPIGCYCKLFRVKFLKDIRFIPEMFIGEGFNFNVMAFQKAEKVIAGIKKCECGLWALEVIKQNLTIHSDRIHEACKYANWRTHSDFYDMCILAGVEIEYSEMYKKCLKVTQKDALDMSSSYSDCYEV